MYVFWSALINKHRILYFLYLSRFYSWKTRQKEPEPICLYSFCSWDDGSGSSLSQTGSATLHRKSDYSLLYYVVSNALSKSKVWKMSRHFLFDVRGAMLFQNSTKGMFVQYQQKNFLWGVPAKNGFKTLLFYTYTWSMWYKCVSLKRRKEKKFTPFSLKVYNARSLK